MRPAREPPRVIGRYVLHGEIASGGMATVQLGRLLGPVGFSRTVAVKRLHAEFARDPEFVSMFLDEARLAARIRHPNVVSTLDVVAEDGELFLVLEFVLGESLGRLASASTKSGRAVPPRIAVGIVTGLLYGLAAAHDATSERGEPLRIVHRDVSPQNVLVGVDGVARVLDFGIAKAVGRMHQTREGVLKGKVAYMPPEQLKSGAVDRRVDIYASAVVLWETLTGAPLFPGENEWQIANGIMEGVREPPSTLAGGIPPALDAAVMRGLSRNPADRFSTAMEMASALEAAMPPATAREIGAWVAEMGGASLTSRERLVADIESSPDGPHSLRAVREETGASPSLATDGAEDAPTTHDATRRLADLEDGPTHSLSGGHFPSFPAASSRDVTATRATPLLLPRTPSPTASIVPDAAAAQAAKGSRKLAVVGAISVALAALVAWVVWLRPSPPLLSPAPSARASEASPPARVEPFPRDPEPTIAVVTPPPPTPPPAPVTPPPDDSVEPEPRLLPEGPGAKPAPRLQAPPSSHKSRCTPPYSIDARGIKHLKPECL